jgi:AraC-like DNA-binding protein
MRLAGRILRDGNMPIASLARSLGYASEAAFTNAFKRATGSPPKRYRLASRKDGAMEEMPLTEAQAALA